MNGIFAVTPILGRVDKYPVIPVLNRNPVVLSPIMT